MPSGITTVFQRRWRWDGFGSFSAPTLYMWILPALGKPSGKERRDGEASWTGSSSPAIVPEDSILPHFSSNAKIRFQSFFMLITTQPCFLAWAISSSGKVPIFDFGP